MDREYNDPIGDMMKESSQKKAFKGNGKPLPKDYLQQDVFQNFQKIAKDAGFLPPWLRLQKEIATLVHSAKTGLDIETINNKIKKHNTICPAPMQKHLISLKNIEKAKKNW